MKFQQTSYTRFLFSGKFIVALAGLTLIAACKKSSTETPPVSSYGPSMSVVNLVSDNSLYAAIKTDTNLVNAWGIAISPNGRIWVSDAGTGVSTVYDGTGATVIQPVIVTSEAKGVRGHPTGIVYNSTTDFMISKSGSPAKFIFAGLDGSVTAWNAGDSAVAVASKTGAVYTGLTMATQGGANYLYAANNSQGTVDVLDNNFSFVNGWTFKDPSMPSGFAPYNVQNIGGLLYVTYAPNGTGSYGTNTTGGYVSIFNTDGTFVKRFASQGTLQSPWGIVQAPSGLGLGQGMILVGSFTSGTISVFDSNGNYKGMLNSAGTAVVIPGLWALVTSPTTATTLDVTAVYFAAGPSSQTHGIFGYIKVH